jgi:hypothetical protein
MFWLHFLALALKEMAALQDGGAAGKRTFGRTRWPFPGILARYNSGPVGENHEASVHCATRVQTH